MKKFPISYELEEKIYDLKINDNDTSSKIVTYFPLNDTEKQEIFELLGKTAGIPIEFKSIFFR